jgi:Zn-dependent M28 family amino/carboxypeptidase
MSADTVFLQPFRYTELYEGKTYELNNIIAQFDPENEKQVLLGAHWDTRPWAELDRDPERRNQPIIGANDGASGVALLLELARILRDQRPDLGISIVFFDGEDMGISGVENSYAQGSLFFAENLPIQKPDYAIIFDMIADADLSIPIERNSYKYNRELVIQLWKTAKELKLHAFKNQLGLEIFDDHVPLWEAAGIPAIDIIDLEYPNRYSNYWHTHMDVPANCSAASLQQVGTLLVNHLYAGE